MLHGRLGVVHSVRSSPSGMDQAAVRAFFRAGRESEQRLLVQTGCRWLALSPVPSEHASRYFAAVAELAGSVEGARIDELARSIAAVRSRRGRLFVLGVGGGAGHASHAVNDFRKLCELESYAPTDNVSELSARINDDGWDSVFTKWLDVSRLSDRDGVLVFSVGGGSRRPPVSANLVAALEQARERGANIYGIVGAPGGALAQLADVAIVIDALPDLRTPLVESFQAVVWHALVSHPLLAATSGHWEALSDPADDRTES